MCSYLGTLSPSEAVDVDFEVNEGVGAEPLWKAGTVLLAPLWGPKPNAWLPLVAGVPELDGAPMLDAVPLAPNENPVVVLGADASFEEEAPVKAGVAVAAEPRENPTPPPETVFVKGAPTGVFVDAGALCPPSPPPKENPVPCPVIGVELLDDDGVVPKVNAMVGTKVM
jgi:hypothetical protein